MLDFQSHVFHQVLT